LVIILRFFPSLVSDEEQVMIENACPPLTSLTTSLRSPSSHVSGRRIACMARLRNDRWQDHITTASRDVLLIVMTEIAVITGTAESHSEPTTEEVAAGRLIVDQPQSHMR
jgi:hypothetical protein